ncbi:hypothetical protein EAH89_04130 [Roseomonas nepalensis]|uniref:Uncharacterized protein n=1 Tax=Muricoccus nepalensis TaxID=1854500 RepID=A0A502GE26_9PROT|nr:hypothetical protein [Roseomonas nepalensis]TPG60557.1 hypothetical protein EAH89_04130 [Roseomonas nepalensis]
MPSLATDSQWIAAAVDTPFIALLAWMLHQLRRSLPQPPDRDAAEPPLSAPPAPPAPSHNAHLGAIERTREELSAFKLEVARTYVPLSLIRDVDGRLTSHLVRIEQKLDEATRTAHSTAAQVRVLAEDR